MAYRIDTPRLVLSFLLMAAPWISAAPATAAVKSPDCAAIAGWAQTIDGKDRWNPIEGGRSWLPRAFAGDDFVALFGAAPLDWTIDEAKSLGAHINDCRRVVADPAAKKALNAARGYINKLNGILVNVERQAAKAERRQQQRQAVAERNAARQAAAADKRAQRQQAAAERQHANLEEAVDRLLAEPDSPELLRALALVRTADVTNRETYMPAFQGVGIGTARALLQLLYNRQANLTEPALLARFAAREGPLRDKVVADRLAEIAALDATMNSINVLSQAGRDLREMGPALTEEDHQTIGIAIRDKRLAIQDTIIARAKELMDNSPASAEGLQRVDKIVVNTRKAIVLPQQINEVTRYARARKQAIGQEALAVAADKLDSFPVTLAGLDDLQHYAIGAARTFGSVAGETAGGQYADVALAKINDVARAVLPEFRQQLAALPDSDEGLKAAEEKIGQAAAMSEVEPDLRADYVAAATSRRDAIDAALAAAFEERRQKALAAGADPDLAGFSFVDRRSGMTLEFRDEERVFFSALGMRFAGTYEVSEDDVIVEGPNGNMVLTKGDKVLTGMGMTLKRQR